MQLAGRVACMCKARVRVPVKREREERRQAGRQAGWLAGLSHSLVYSRSSKMLVAFSSPEAYFYTPLELNRSRSFPTSLTRTQLPSILQASMDLADVHSCLYLALWQFSFVSGRGCSRAASGGWSRRTLKLQPATLQPTLKVEAGS